MEREILSQEEIDTLVAGLSGGAIEDDAADTADGECQRYNFSRPTRFSRDALRSIQAVHDSYARLMSSTMSSQLRVRAQMEVVSVSQTTCEEFLRSTPVPTVITQFDLDEDLGVAVMGLEPALALAMIVLALGGKPDSGLVSRDLTETELAIMREFSGRLLSGLSYSWQGIAKVNPQIDLVHTNPQSTRIAAPSEAVVLVTMSVKLGTSGGLLSFCYPHPSIGEILSLLNRDVHIGGPQAVAGADRARFTLRALNPVQVNLLASMGEARLNLDEVMRLRPGAVLTLDRDEGEDIDMCFEGLTVFKGQPGLLGQHMAVRFSGWGPTSE